MVAITSVGLILRAVLNLRRTDPEHASVHEAIKIIVQQNKRTANRRGMKSRQLWKAWSARKSACTSLCRPGLPRWPQTRRS
jgi:hypothetical protein